MGVLGLKLRLWIISVLSVGAILLLISGLVLQQTWLVGVVALALLGEALFWRWKFFSSGLRSQMGKWLSLYSKADAVSEKILIQEIQSLLGERTKSHTSAGTQQCESLIALVQLRRLFFHPASSPKDLLEEAFLLRKKSTESPTEIKQVSFEEVSNAATSVANLFWKVLFLAKEDSSRASTPAKKLLEAVLGQKFEVDSISSQVENLTDLMQRHGGIPFLILNLVTRGNYESARALGKKLLTSEPFLDEEMRASLYWVAELQWFVKNSISVSDFETTIRHLYHLCFSNPERAGFLEVDSQFFSQFETVNELAKEGFVFKEDLVDRILSLWGEYSGFFNGAFKEILQILTRQKSKIYQDQITWMTFWEKEKESFEREYLFIVEGNLCYIQKDFKNAVTFYQRALEINPHLRAGLFNLLFCYAQQGDKSRHTQLVNEILENQSLFPFSLSVIGNSYLLLGDLDGAEEFYSQLRLVEGWRNKTEYYQSTFCLEHGLIHLAVELAQKAYLQNPSDISVSYHLCQCLSAVGEKAQALEILKKLEGVGPQWLHYYRFTLERDSGRMGEAHQTLVQIPIEYFDDPDELEAAVDFARHSSDLGLLRRLKSKK